MKWTIFSGLVALLLAIVLGGCAPGASPPSAPAPVPQAAPAAPAFTPEEAAWQQVVAAARKEGKLTVYTYWLGEPILIIQKGFQDRYGIPVEFITGKGASNLERLRTEQRMGKMVADAVFASTLHVVNAHSFGLTTSLADLAALKEKDVWAVRPDALSVAKEMQWVEIAYSTYSSWVNTKRMDPADAPKSYRELLTAKWKDKIIVTHPETNSAMYNMFVPLLNKGVVDLDYVKALGKQNLLLKPHSEAATLSLAQGEGPFLLTGATSVSNQYVAEGAPIKPVVMEEGTTVHTSPGGYVVKGSSHPNAAKVFVNWLLTQEGQEVYGKALSISSMRKDVTDYTPAVARFTPKKIILSTLEDLDQSANMFKERVFPKLWKE